MITTDMIQAIIILATVTFLYAVGLAKKHSAKIVVLHAIELVPPYVEAYGGMTDEFKKKRFEEIVEFMKKHLEGFCKKAEAYIGPPCVGLVFKILVPKGHPPEVILNDADQEGCNVIVIETHGKGFLSHAFLGSVLRAVLHRTRKPVFIIPLPSDKTAVDWDGI